MLRNDPGLPGSAFRDFDTQCLSNIKQLAIALQIYTTDSDDRLPIASSWRTAVSPYAKDGMIHPSSCPDAKTKWTYAMNSNLAIAETTKISSPEATVFLFEVESDVPDVTGNQSQVVRRHRDASFYAFLDCMAKKVKREEEASLKWLAR